MKLSNYTVKTLLNEIIERNCLEDLLSDNSCKNMVINFLQFVNTKDLINELENREDLRDHVECVSDILVESKLSNFMLSQSYDRNSAKEYINIILKLNGLGDVNDVIDAVKELYKF